MYPDHVGGVAEQVGTAFTFDGAALVEQTRKAAITTRRHFIFCCKIA